MTDEALTPAPIDVASTPPSVVPPSPAIPLQDTEESHAPLASASPAQLPTQTSFSTREELLRYMTDFSLSQGYAVVIHKSNVPRGQLWLRCDMGGASRNLPVAPSEAKRKRKVPSRLQNCPFQLYGRRLMNGTWALKVQNPQHTHEPANDPQDLELHPKARRLTNAQKLLVVQLTDSGVRPSIIVDRMKEKFPGKPVKVRDIYNARNYIRTERRAGRVAYPECTVEGDEPQLMITEASVPSSAALSDGEEVKQLWVKVNASMTEWSEEKKEAFRDEFQRLVDKFSTSETDLVEANGSNDEHEEDEGADEVLNGQVTVPELHAVQSDSQLENQ